MYCFRRRAAGAQRHWRQAQAASVQCRVRSRTSDLMIGKVPWPLKVRNKQSPADCSLQSLVTVSRRLFLEVSRLKIPIQLMSQEAAQPYSHTKFRANSSFVHL